MAENFTNVLTAPDGTITTLAAPMDTDDVAFTTAALLPSALRSGQARIRIDNELILATVNSSGAIVDAQRGVEGTTADSHASGAKVRHVLTAGSLNAALDALLPRVTADTFQSVRYIAVGGVVKPIPVATPVPVAPLGLAASAKLSSVRLTWSAAAGAAQYAVYRNGTQFATTAATGYRDIAITADSTYTYRVQTIDAYGQRSPLSGSVSAFIDPDTNSAPVVTVTAWPAELASVGRSLLRVNGEDVDAQELAFLIDVDEGTITPTDDPTAWWWTR